MRRLALLLIAALLLSAAPAFAVEVPGDLQEKVRRGLLFPAVPGEPREIMMALEFAVGSVEQAAHAAMRSLGSPQGAQALSRLEGEMARFNEVMNHLQNLALYRLAEPKKRVAALNEILKFRLALVEVVRVVMEKSDAPNDRGNLKRYGKAAEAARRPLREIAKILGI